MRSIYEPKPQGPAKVSLATFIKLKTKHTHRMAGFRHWAEAGKLGPQPISEWEALYQAFQARPL